MALRDASRHPLKSGKQTNRSVKLVDCMTEPAYNIPNVDAQAEEEELPPNPSAEILMADPATVQCDGDVEVKFLIKILTFQLYITDLE